MSIPRREQMPIREVERRIPEVDIDSLVEKIAEEGITKKNEKEILERILKLRFEKGFETLELQELISNNLIEKMVPSELQRKTKELVAITSLFSLDDEGLKLVFSSAESPDLIRKIKIYLKEFSEYRGKVREKLKEREGEKKKVVH